MDAAAAAAASEPHVGPARTTKYPQYQVRERERELTPDVVELLARQEAVTVEIVPLGQRQFSSERHFIQVWDEYSASNLLMYRRTTSQTRETYFKMKPVGFDDSFPNDMERSFFTMRCVHGCHQGPRGKGRRGIKHIRYTQCTARITVRAVRHASGEWVYETCNENTLHNHNVNDLIYDSYKKPSEVLDDRYLFEQLRDMIMMSAPTRKICDILTIRTGRRFKSQDIANFKRDRIGGGSVQEGLERMLTTFVGLPDSSCLLVEDDDHVLCGIVLQTAAQKLVFENYGDSLILDWTHNTNNANFHLGSLVATAVTGQGVSVLDFLCLNQTKMMMRAVLQHFIRTNGGCSNVCSIVIDKDYTEWAILEEVFPDAAILLCQFHVLQWFREVVRDRKYLLREATQDAVIKILSEMVYADTKAKFEALQFRLKDLLHESSPQFLKYMEDRWYNCLAMWSDFERKKVFDAGNTTSNRIESAWNQVKLTLGGKLRLDLCLEAIFARQTAVLWRLYNEIAASYVSTRTRFDCDNFLRSALRDVSDYPAKLVRRQWDKYASLREANNEHAYRVVRADVHGGTIDVERPRRRSSTYTVDTRTSQCSCGFHVSTRLPCRHLLFVLRDVLGRDELPVEVIPPRWRLSVAHALLRPLHAAILDVQKLRILEQRDHPAWMPEPPPREQTSNTVLPNPVLDPPGEATRSTPGYSAPLAASLVLHATAELSTTERNDVLLSIFDDHLAHLRQLPAEEFVAKTAQAREALAAVFGVREGLVHHAPYPESAVTCNPAPAATSVSFSGDNYYRVHVAPSSATSVASSLSWDPAPRFAPSTPGVTSPRNWPQQLLQPPSTLCAESPPHWAAVVAHDEATLSVHPTSAFESCDDPFAFDPELDDGTTAQDMIRWLASNLFDSELESDMQPASPIDAAPAGLRGSELHAAGESAFSTPSLRLGPSHVIQGCPAPSTAPTSDHSGVERTPGERVQAAFAMIKLPTRVGTRRAGSASAKGKNTKKKNKKTPTKSPGIRSPKVSPARPCSVRLAEFNRCLRLIRDKGAASRFWTVYPMDLQDLQDEALKAAVPTVELLALPPPSHPLAVVVPRDVFDAMNKAVRKAPSLPQQQTVDGEAPIMKHVVTLRPGDRKFTGENVADLRDYYVLGDLIHRYEEDVTWISHHVPLEPGEALSLPQWGRQYLPANIRAVVRSKFEQLPFAARFTRPNLWYPATTFLLEDLIGNVCGSWRLNDSIVLHGLRVLTSVYTNVCVVDTIGNNPLAIPLRAFSADMVVIFPTHFTNHWCLVYVFVDGADNMAVRLYDPLMSQDNISRLRRAWDELYEPFMRRWRATGRSSVGGNDLATRSVTWDRILKQPPRDFTSCGILCVAKGIEIADPLYHHRDTRYQAHPRIINAFRLRLLWYLLAECTVVDPASTDAHDTLRAALGRPLGHDSIPSLGTSPSAGAKKKHTHKKRRTGA